MVSPKQESSGRHPKGRSEAADGIAVDVRGSDALFFLIWFVQDPDV